MGQAKELTVRQVREIIDTLEKQENVHTVDMLFSDEIPALAVSMSTGKSLEELQGDITPSELAAIIEEVKEAKPFFVKMIQRLSEIGEAALKETT